MLAQAFAMIARNNDDGIVVSAGFFQVCDPIRQRRVGVSDFAVIKMVFIFLGKRRRWLVRIMRVVHVDPHEVWSRSMLVEPRFGMLNHFHAAPLHASPAFFGFSLSGKVIVKIKAPIEPRGESVAVENYGSNKSRSLVALFLQQFRRS